MGLVKEALDAFPQLTADTFKGSPIETEPFLFVHGDAGRARNRGWPFCQTRHT